MIPSNTPAEVWVPAGGRRLQVEPDGATFVRIDGHYAVYHVLAGTRTFRSRLS